MTDTVAKMLPVFREIFDDDELEIAPQTSAKDVLGWDSLANVRLMIRLEEAFGVRLKSSEVARMQNVGDLASLIDSKISSK